MKIYHQIILSVTILLALSGCSTAEPDKETEDILGRVKIGAAISGIGNTGTRGYQEEGKVLSGNMNLTFLNKDREFEVGSVAFENGIGYASRIDNSRFIDLKWVDLSTTEESSRQYSFYLDNLPAAYGTDVNISLPEENPFHASVFDEVEGSNDLLWGALLDIERSPTLSFDLNHVMSRFCLRVYFDNSNGFERLTPESAKISNLFQHAVSFDRLTGTLGLDENPDEEDFILVTDYDSWDRKEVIENNKTVNYYVSPDFVIPPQNFVSNKRPRLTVVLSNGESYSGLFPLAMTLVGENNVMTPWMMSFLRGYKLTLTVMISNGGQSLQFMPVTLLEWVDKGIKNLTGSQAAIEDEEGMKALINAYNGRKVEEFYKWGYKNGDIWIFNIFQNLEFSLKSGEKMEEQKDLPYEFNIYNSTVIVNLPDGRSVSLTQNDDGANKLKTILNGGTI